MRLIFGSSTTTSLIPTTAALALRRRKTDVDIALVSVTILSFVLGSWIFYRRQRKNEKIFRELDRIRYQSQSAVNLIEMSKMTPHGPKDRDDYLDLAIQSSIDAQKIAINLSKEL